jgi:hypothetical protein
MLKIKPIRSKVKQRILLLLLAGLSLSLTRTGRQQWQIVKGLHREWKKLDQIYLRRYINEFKHDRLIDWREEKDGSISVVLTEQGKVMASRFNPDKMRIARPSRWDGRWRVVIYDIPHFKKSARDALRHKLHELGFIEWQKSVFIFPHPCREEINFVIEFFDLRPCVRQAELTNPTNESELRLAFKL